MWFGHLGPIPIEGRTEFWKERFYVSHFSCAQTWVLVPAPGQLLLVWLLKLCPTCNGHAGRRLPGQLRPPGLAEATTCINGSLLTYFSVQSISLAAPDVKVDEMRGPASKHLFKQWYCCWLEMMMLAGEDVDSSCFCLPSPPSAPSIWDYHSCLTLSSECITGGGWIRVCW